LKQIFALVSLMKHLLGPVWEYSLFSPDPRPARERAAALGGLGEFETSETASGHRTAVLVTIPSRNFRP